MSTDRTIHWISRRAPTRADVDQVLRDFFNGAATSIRWDRDRFVVIVPGKHRNALCTVSPIIGSRHQRERVGKSAPLPSQRWLEVWIDPDDGTVDVITRQADDYTCALADGIAAVLARYWEGELVV